MANIALLRKVMEHIEAHPNEHNQKHWVTQAPCGTTCCFAGRAVVMTGWTPIFDEDGIAWKCFRNGEGWNSIDSVAASELGLSMSLADMLFSWANSIQDLRWIVDSIIAKDANAED